MPNQRSVCMLLKRKCVPCEVAYRHAQQAAVHPMQWPADILDMIQYEVRSAVLAKHGAKIKDSMGWKKVHAEMKAKYEMYIEYEMFRPRNSSQFEYNGYWPEDTALHPQVAFAYNLTSGEVFDPTSLEHLLHLKLSVTEFAVGCESLVSDWA